MSPKFSKDKIHQLLRERGLRITAPRVAILQHLASSQTPISHSDLIDAQKGATWNASTTFRTLRTLTQEKLAAVVSRADGIDRYAFVGTGKRNHEHAHFVCDNCGEVSCLPDSAKPALKTGSRWAASIKSASI